MGELSTTAYANSQQFWLKIQCGNLKSFLICTAYRPDTVPFFRFLDDLTTSLMDSLLLSMDVIITGDLNANVLPGSIYPTSFPGFSPTRPTERARERPWETLVTCLPESGRLQTNDLGKGQVSVRFVSTERRQVSAAMKLCT